VSLHDKQLPVNQKPKWFDNWIQHITIVGNYSLSVIHIHPHIVLPTWQPENKKSPVLNLWAFLHRKADKVIMTMVTLLVNPTISTCVLTPATLHQACPSSLELIILIPKTCTTSTQFFSQSNSLWDSPTTVPMTAATSAAADDEQPPSHSLLALLEEDTMTITPAFLKQWNAFYIEFVQTNWYYQPKPWHLQPPLLMLPIMMMPFNPTTCNHQWLP